MPSRSDRSIPARATRSASRSNAAAQPSNAVKRQAEAILKVEGSTNSTPRSRVTKSADRRPASTPRPQSRQVRVKSPGSPLIKVKDEGGDEDDAKRTGPCQHQQAQDIARPSHPLATPAGSWQLVPTGHALSENFHHGPPPFPPPYSGPTGIPRALQELYWQRHDRSFEGTDLGTFVREYHNIQGQFPLIERHWIAAIWKRDMGPNDLEKIALEYDSFDPSPRFVEGSSERKFRLFLSGFEIYSSVVCQFSPERRLPLHEIFATYRLHLLSLLRTRTLDSVITYHHLSVGHAMTYGQDRPEHWDIDGNHHRYSVLLRRPDILGM